MALSMNVKIEGMDAIQASLKRFPEVGRKNYAKASLDSAALLASAVRGSQRTPVDTGFMINKIGYQRVGAMGAMMYVGTRYAVVVHQGIANDIQLPDGGRNVFIPGVGWRHLTVIKARPARPFVDWALQDGAQARIDAIWGKALSDTLATA